jgi:hypothetical protein
VGLERDRKWDVSFLRLELGFSLAVIRREECMIERGKSGGGRELREGGYALADKIKIEVF